MDDAGRAHQMTQAGRVSVVERLVELGGVADRATLLRLTSRAAVDRALREGSVVRISHGRYCLPQADEALRAAHALSGILSHTSAALWWGWELKQAPERPHVIVPANRKVDPHTRLAVAVHHADLHPEDVRGPATSHETTLLQCLRSLPFDEALAVADSALRHGVPPSVLRRIARSVQGPGAVQVRRAAAEARAEAANPFESVLRAIALDVPGLNVKPQQVLPNSRARPDLFDEDLGIVLEADSFEWHGDRAALRRDARRYNVMVIDGHLVLRFSWEDVMFEHERVRSVLLAAVDLVRRRGKVHDCRCNAA